MKRVLKVASDGISGWVEHSDSGLEEILKMFTVVFSILAVVIGVAMGLYAASSALFGDDLDYGYCLQWHTETRLLPTGKAIVPVQVNSCDVWQYPQGIAAG